MFSKFYLLSKENTTNNIETLGYLYGRNGNNDTIIQNKQSYFITNKLIGQKEKEAITTTKHRLFNKQLRKLQETSIFVININWKRKISIRITTTMTMKWMKTVCANV